MMGEIRLDMLTDCRSCRKPTRIFNLWWPIRVCVKCSPVVHSTDMKEDIKEELTSLSELYSRYV